MPSGHGPVARLTIRLLGPPEILVDGRPLAVDTRKAVAILALLAVEVRPFARDEIAALLWPESDDVAARGALRRTLSALHAAVGEGPLLIERGRIALDPGRVDVDLDRVQRAATSTDRATLTKAVALARGGFLSGFHLRDSPEFDDWRASRAVAIERTVLTLLDRLVVAAERDGDVPAAIGAANRLLDLDPLDEGAHVRLMELLAASGDRSGALRQYRTCVATLQRELGVAPLATTTARYEAIRGGAGASSAPVTGGISSTSDAGLHVAHPRPTLPLVARDHELATIDRVGMTAASGVGQVVAIVGEAGIGKTRLAETALARAVEAGSIRLGATAYPTEAGIAYGPIVDLLRAALALLDGGARAGHLDAAIRLELARLLPAIDPHRSIAAVDGVGSHARLVAAIADGLTALTAGRGAGVIWIDDIQWLDGSSREALLFLARRLTGRRLLIVLAWRPEDLDADGRAFVAALHGAVAVRTIELRRLDRAAVTTLVAASGVERADSDSDAADGALVDRLLTASEGLPLYIAEALAGGPMPAPGSLPGGVASVLRQRLAAIDETSGQVLAAAAVIGRSFDVAILRFASGRSDDETLEAIEAAIRHGLIHETANGYDFNHAALRDLAYEAITMARRRLLHGRVAEALRLDLGRSGRDDLARLVLIANHEQAAGRDREAADAYRDAGRRAAELFANREAIAHDEAALALGHPDVVALHAAIGSLLTRLGDYGGATTSLEAAAAQASPAELPGLERALGRAYLRRGDLVAADHHLTAAIDATSEAATQAAALVDLSVIRRRVGDRPGAAEAASRALSSAMSVEDRIAAGGARRMLGLLALDAGDAQEAVRQLARASADASSDPDPTARISALAALALAEAFGGSVEAGLAHAEAAIAECRRIGDRHLEAAVENHAADLLHEAGRDEEALVHLRRAVEAFAEVGGSPPDPDPGIWMLSAS